MEVLVAGGTGFIGRPLCRVLNQRGHDVTAGSRSPEDVALPAGVDRVSLDVTDRDLTGVVAGHDAVVNLVALPSHYQPRGRTHESVHLDGTKNLVAASESTGVGRFVQMSALGVDSGVQTDYFRAKRGAEAVVRESALDPVVYRPSVVFGDGCAFLPFLERLVDHPVAPLPGQETTRFQPMWIGDLAPMIADGVTESRHTGEAYELGGPERLTIRETVELVGDPHVTVPLPSSLVGNSLAVAEHVPGVPVGLDQYRVMQVDNTVEDNDVTAFGRMESDLRPLAEYLRGGS